MQDPTRDDGDEGNDIWAEGMNPETATAVWRERERRQRTLRTLMMFMLMLLVMDGEEAAQRRQNHMLLKQKKSIRQKLDRNVFETRQRQEERIRRLVKQHERYEALLEKNHGEAVGESVVAWAEEHAGQEKDHFVEGAVQIPSQEIEKDPEEDRKVFHYPWNATGFYRGEWARTKTETKEVAEKKEPAEEALQRNSTVLPASALEETMMEVLRDRNEELGVFILPDGMKIDVRNDNNLTSVHWENLRIDKNNAIVQRSSKFDKSSTNKKPGLSLDHDSGHAAFQFFSRSVPSMQELSIVDGFVKIYDSTSAGYFTRKDLLLRVRGVLIHAIGRISLVSNVDVSRSAFMMGEDHPMIESSVRRRRLDEALSNLESVDVEAIRDDALALFADSSSLGKRRLMASSPELSHRRLSEDDVGTERQSLEMDEETTESRKALDLTQPSASGNTSSVTVSPKAVDEEDPKWSDAVLPYPFVMDDEKETVRRVKTPASRVMPQREQGLEENAAGCAFEIQLDVVEEEWTIGEWRTLVKRKVEERKKLNPSLENEDEPGNGDSIMHLRGSRPKPIQDLALIMTMNGTIHSANCDFTAMVNATALRTDWEATTSKAINYSFVMMVICLTQILVLLRQLLHSQGTSAAVRVSLLCIGWQALIDALHCMSHIYMSLSIQPLFSAFASVSFFKLLIFCVIEMKYMAIIIQARNSSNGGQPADVLRRQIAMLHLRFYTAMAGSFLLLLYTGDKYRLFYVLLLYSFWVPQIILNIVTEAKAPMHHHYIYGMSLTRLFAPLYLLYVKQNFLKEVYPEAPHDPYACYMLVLWVGIQTAVLMGQRKYGARFMIPVRFQPPKFDYSRPIPLSMLPPGVTELPAVESMEDRGEDALHHSERDALLDTSSRHGSSTSGRRHTTAVTTRNRIRRTAARNESSSGGGMTAERPTAAPATAPIVGLDCSICYDTIDIRKRHDYMLAPCNHLFHRECLVQWMDVKMECPICRTGLPAL